MVGGSCPAVWRWAMTWRGRCTGCGGAAAGQARLC